MRSVYLLFIYLTLVLQIICSNLNATDYNLSLENNIVISEPGSHTITGNGNSTVTIAITEPEVDYSITLNNVTINAPIGHAIQIVNPADGPGQVNLIVNGTNTLIGYNGSGISADVGMVYVKFSSSSQGLLNCSSINNSAFGNSIEYLKPYIGSDIICTAKLNNTFMDVSAALDGAFDFKPLILSFTNITTSIEENSKLNYLNISQTESGVEIKGIQKGGEIKIIDIYGKCILNSISQNNQISVNLPKGVYILNTEQGNFKFIH